jgi:N-methylhydantoinase B
VDDVAAGLLDAPAAERLYGVVVRGGALDPASTEALRYRRRGERASLRFDLGEAREAHERTWTPELYDRFLGIVMSLPVSYRSYVRRTLFRRLRDEGGDLDALWAALRHTLRLR